MTEVFDKAVEINGELTRVYREAKYTVSMPMPDGNLVYVFYISDIPGLDEVPYDEQSSLVKFFCAVWGAKYCCTTSDDGSRDFRFKQAVEEAHAEGYEYIVYDDLS